MISRDELLNSCWGLTYYGTTPTLDQHILVLREKLGPEGHHLVSVRSLGYKFAASLWGFFETNRNKKFVAHLRFWITITSEIL